MSTRDVLASSGEARGRRMPAGRTPRRRASGWTIGVLALAIAASLTSGIVAAAELGGGGPQPEDVLPGTAFAFGKLDFDPAAGQKLAVRELASRFPDAPSEELTGLRDELVRSILEDEDTEVDFDRDIKPWLGDRVGFAAFTDEDDDAQVVFAVQTKDAEQTRAALAKLVEEDEKPIPVVFRRGYALFAEKEEVLLEATALADESSIADAPQFRDDRSRIGDEQIAVLWADYSRMIDAMLAAEDVSGEDEFSLRLRDAAQGRVVMGLHAEREYVELEALTLGAAPGAGGGRPSTLQRLPDETTAAAFVFNVSGMTEQIAGALGPLGFYLGTSLFLPFAYYESAEAIDGESVDLEGLDEEGLDEEGLDEIQEDPFGDGSVGPDPTLEPEGPDFFEALKIADRELAPLLADEATLVLPTIPDDDELQLGFVARVLAPGNAMEPMQRVLRAFGFDEGSVTVVGDLLYAGTTKAEVDRLAKGGTLGETERFRLAMGELDNRVSAAVYADLERIGDTTVDFPAELEPLGAIGLVVTEEDGVQRLRLRVVAQD